MSADPTLNVFISWSMPRGRKLAEALYQFLPDVVQNANPWLSSEDVEKGRRFGSELAGALKTAQIGIVCLTPESIDAPWLLFEAGALAKTLETAHVCPYLLGLDHHEVRPPLADFQMTKAHRDDTLRLVRTLNTALGNTVDPERLGRTFDRAWPTLETVISDLLKQGATPSRAPAPREQADIMEEVLARVRGIERRVEERSEGLTIQTAGGSVRFTNPAESSIDRDQRTWRHLITMAEQRLSKATSDDERAAFASLIADMLRKRPPLIVAGTTDVQRPPMDTVAQDS